MENYKLKKYIKFFESIYKKGKKYKIWWYWNPKTKLLQHKGPISSKNIDTNKIVV